MVVGFNHNVQYKGAIYHVQTEDSGIANPQITTLLYRGGTILSSQKTSYADIIKIDELEKIVEELMKDQHKDMLRSLKAGDFDERINEIFSDSIPASPPKPAVSEEKRRELPLPSERRTLTAEDIFPDCFSQDKKC